MTLLTRPLPPITPLDRPFWRYARRHELRLQRCLTCAKYRFPASPVCAECFGGGYEWAQVSGRGRILTYAVFHHGYFDWVADRLPYNVAIVALEEGVNLISNVSAPNEALRSGMPVEVWFEDLSPEVSIPQFRPAAAAA